MSIVINCGNRSEADQYASCKTLGGLMTTAALFATNAVMAFQLALKGQAGHRFFNAAVTIVTIAMVLQVTSMILSGVLFFQKYPEEQKSDAGGQRTCPRRLRRLNDAILFLNSAIFVVQLVVKVVDALNSV
ncbi:hypothetical protein CAPTEDRAFT_195111 [Capitella teleta]|uniref:Uncharacterized protein n=1 Tax=Capitella teleta TaxID=283909 RepID=R7UQ43_CAPTE|nr:hypothetical protein CAPTEDRAFT_195111 [Capitella teleta]|eukprot:ELU08325.1 hypothetical protein CAPTEDRAFT_195111 [Capitella teleta]